MFQTFIEAAIGSIVVLAFAFVFSAQPVRAGECKGQVVVASWYGTESGSRTATGERFDGSSFTAAHKTMPFGTKLRVSYKGKSVVVRINDRGPFIRGRSLDLAHAAARKIGLTKAGVGRVCVQRLG